ncbi:MAG: response regulator [Thermoproteota archaeon]|nr:response regulator [Thermoproteota archaeon]
MTASNSVHAATRRKILLVDDDADVVSTFQMILEMNGFEVEAYTSPTSALSNYKPNEFGLLILDIRMPVMNGFELFKKIKSIENNVEACFITAYEDYREEFKESFPMLDEAKYFIRKPKAIEDLVNHVSTLLG